MLAQLKAALTALLVQFRVMPPVVQFLLQNCHKAPCVQKLFVLEVRPFTACLLRRQLVVPVPAPEHTQPVSLCCFDDETQLARQQNFPTLMAIVACKLSCLCILNRLGRCLIENLYKCGCGKAHCHAHAAACMRMVSMVLQNCISPW